jgi:hypothetical protein
MKIELLASLFSKMLKKHSKFCAAYSQKPKFHTALDPLKPKCKNEHNSPLTHSDPNVLRSLAKELQDWPVSLNFDSVPQFIRIYDFANLFLFILREVTQENSWNFPFKDLSKNRENGGESKVE